MLLSSFWTSRGHRCRPFSPPSSAILLIVGFSSSVANSSSRTFHQSICAQVFFCFTFRRKEKIKAKAHHTSTYFHTPNVSIKLNCVRNPAFSGVSFISRDSDSTNELSLPAVPVITPAAQAAVVYGCVSISTRPGPWGSGAVEAATQNGIIPDTAGLAQAHPLNPYECIRVRTRRDSNSRSWPIPRSRICSIRCVGESVVGVWRC